MLHIHAFTFNPFQENTYVIFNEEKDAWIVDPGNQNPVEDQKLLDFIEEKQLKPNKIINTHSHLDHIFGNQTLVEAYDIPVVLHQDEHAGYRAAPQVAQMYGLPPFEIPPIDEFFKMDEPLYLGGERFDLLFTPGHSPAEVSLHHGASNSLISGAVLFRDSIGPTDLPGGDHPTLLKSIRDQLWPLPDDTKVYPGHGPQTTIGYEKENNPFLN